MLVGRVFVWCLKAKVVVVAAGEALVWLMRKWLGLDLLLNPSLEGLLSASDSVTHLCSLSCHSPCQQPLHTLGLGQWPLLNHLTSQILSFEVRQPVWPCHLSSRCFSPASRSSSPFSLASFVCWKAKDALHPLHFALVLSGKHQVSKQNKNEKKKAGKKTSEEEKMKPFFFFFIIFINNKEQSKTKARCARRLCCESKSLNENFCL